MTWSVWYRALLQFGLNFAKQWVPPGIARSRLKWLFMAGWWAGVGVCILIRWEETFSTWESLALDLQTGRKLQSHEGHILWATLWLCSGLTVLARNRRVTAYIVFTILLLWELFFPLEEENKTAFYCHQKWSDISLRSRTYDIFRS